MTFPIDKLIALASDRDPELSPALILLQLREDVELLKDVEKLLLSKKSQKRRIALRILAGKLGERFLPESGKILKHMIQQEHDEGVLEALVSAAGQLRIGGRSIFLKKLVAHKSPKIRQALAIALGGESSKQAQQSLATLSEDDDSLVRNLATFSLGSLSHRNDPAVRDTLFKRVGDSDKETREEAIFGLAARKDRRIIDLIIEILQGPDVSTLIIEAAAEIGSPKLYPYLIPLKKRASRVNIDLLNEAIKSCKPKSNNQ